MVLRRCRRLLKDEAAALDALQDVFARLMEKDHTSLEFPSSFLYTMATRICIDRIRSARSQPVKEAEGILEEIAASGDLEARMFAGRILDRLFRREEGNTRVIAVLYYVDGLSYEEVAEQVGLSASAVRKRLERLRSRSAPWAARSRADRTLRDAEKAGNR
jgi:RNA polymerase sigma-70 factor (ECF subfamily)